MLPVHTLDMDVDMDRLTRAIHSQSFFHFSAISKTHMNSHTVHRHLCLGRWRSIGGAARGWACKLGKKKLLCEILWPLSLRFTPAQRVRTRSERSE